jgi:hypothetical protein
LRQYYACDNDSPVSSTNREDIVSRPTYGISEGSSSSTVGHDFRAVTTKKMPQRLFKTGENIREKLLNDNSISRKFSNDQQVILKQNTFNHCTVLIYFSDKEHKLKTESTLGKHCDCMHDHNGNFIHKNNAQMENTPTVVLTLGENRILPFFRRHVGVSEAGNMVWEDDAAFYEEWELTDGSVFVLHPNDEKPTLKVCQNNNIPIKQQYQHGNIAFKGNISIGIVFRIVTKSRNYRVETNTLVPSQSELQLYANKHVTFKQMDSIMGKIDISYVQELFKKLSDKL